MLAERAFAILQAVVEEYVGTCAPVGSKSLVSRHGMGVSSATVRSDLAGLERTGHLTHPHTSAGRVPTDLGYRTVVERRLAHGAPPIAASLASTLRAADLRALARVLAEVTRCLAVVAQPSSETGVVASLTLTPLTGGRVTLVVVTDDGHVSSRTLQTDLGRQSLARVAEAAADATVGRGPEGPLPEISGLDGAEVAFLDEVLRATRALSCAPHEGTAEHAGMALLLDQPEFRDREALREVADALEEPDVEMDSRYMRASDGLMVVIGRENSDRRLRSLSVVAKEYHATSGVGYVACLGPTRMDYPLVIGAVETAARRAGAICQAN